ncbi:hypothetical protein D1B32_23570, partial [Oceanobacillus profundus]
VSDDESVKGHTAKKGMFPSLLHVCSIMFPSEEIIIKLEHAPEDKEHNHKRKSMSQVIHHWLKLTRSAGTTAKPQDTKPLKKQRTTPYPKPPTNDGKFSACYFKNTSSMIFRCRI